MAAVPIKTGNHAHQINGLVSIITTFSMKELISKSFITIIPLPLRK